MAGRPSGSPQTDGQHRGLVDVDRPGSRSSPGRFPGGCERTAFSDIAARSPSSGPSRTGRRAVKWTCPAVSGQDPQLAAGATPAAAPGSGPGARSPELRFRPQGRLDDRLLADPDEGRGQRPALADRALLRADGVLIIVRVRVSRQVHVAGVADRRKSRFSRANHRPDRDRGMKSPGSARRSRLGPSGR